uniref:uncharacterized protein LOC124065563 isoform X2 n=1 Tax=Scatophagus argus TaxID=75038 RepID=UPI001ED82A30|nr:uncharacterized protein LOC124065563 isoform X2 [Scatophagus argus]
MATTERNTSSKQAIKIFPRQGTEFTSEDLLNMSLPFGSVVSVQKIANNGSTYGVVMYSNADDAAKAMMKLNSTTDFSVSLFKPMKVGEPHKNEISESQSDKPPSLPQGMFNGKLQRLPSLLDSLYPPPYTQSVSLQIQNLPKHLDQRYQVLSLLPPSTISVKMEKRRAMVMLPDLSTALWLMDFLNGLYSGFKQLHVSFANQRHRARPTMRTAHRELHQQHQGPP